MPWKSRWTCDIPRLDLASYVFPSQTESLGTKPLIIDAERSEKYWLSHDTYRFWCKRVAAGLIKNGLKPGDRVLLFSGNTLFFPCVFLGVIMAGGVFSGANPGYVSRELAYQLKDTGAKFLITAEASLQTSLEAADSIGFPRDHIFAFDSGYDTFDGTGKDQNDIKHWSRLLATPAEAENFRWKAVTDENELARTTVCLNYSSGTTGVPKGVEITHRAYVANTVQVSFNTEQDPDYQVRRENARWLCMLPMYHAYGQTYYCVTGPVRGIPYFIMQKFDFVKMLKHLQNHRITDLTLVPPIAVALAKSPLTKEYDLSSVLGVGCGAAPLGNEVSRELERLWPNGKINVKQGWGMTEVTCSMCSWHPSDTSTTAAVGELMANCEAMLVEEDGSSEAPEGQRGELWVRGPNVMKGYWQKPEATQDTLTSDGWLKTGDIAYRDETNKLYIVDRKKELIKVKGNQVAPAELEALLLEMDEVADAAVIGVTINGEELPRAYLVLKQDKHLQAQDVHTFMEKKVSRHKRLMGGIVFVDAIPKNPSGKILRKVLREQAKNEVGDSEPRASRL